MHRIDAKNATQDGLFTDGDPHKPEEEVATYLDAAWLNAVQEEVCNIITQNEIELKKGDNSQLGSAIGKAIDHKLDNYLPIKDNAGNIQEIKKKIGMNSALVEKEMTILERLDALETKANRFSQNIEDLESGQKSYAARTQKLETTTSGHIKNLSTLNEFKGNLDANLSVKRIEQTFTRNGEKINILSDASQCSGVILLHVKGKGGGVDYFEYDFKCRKGKPNYYGSDNLVYLHLKEHSQVTSSHKSLGARCRIINNKIYLEQDGAEPDFPHAVSCRIIGFMNE